MREKIALKVVKAIYMDRDSSQPMTDISLDIADQILSLPSGLIAGEHELTVQEALDRLPLLLKVAECVPIEGDCMDIFECPKDGSLCTTDNCPIDDALTFNGERIRRNDERKDSRVS